MTITSRLSRGEVLAEVGMPSRNPPKQALLRIRVPDGWRVVSAKSDSQSFSVDATGAIDISSLKENVSIHFGVQHQ